MATIKIIAESSKLGPSLPTKHGASIGERKWPGGGTTPILRLFIGDCDIEVWPADPDYIEELGNRLIMLAKDLKVKQI